MILVVENPLFISLLFAADSSKPYQYEILMAAMKENANKGRDNMRCLRTFFAGIYKYNNEHELSSMIYHTESNII